MIGTYEALIVQEAVLLYVNKQGLLFIGNMYVLLTTRDYVDLLHVEHQRLPIRVNLPLAVCIHVPVRRRLWTLYVFYHYSYTRPGQLSGFTSTARHSTQGRTAIKWRRSHISSRSRLVNVNKHQTSIHSTTTLQCAVVSGKSFTALKSEMLYKARGNKLDILQRVHISIDFICTHGNGPERHEIHPRASSIRIFVLSNTIRHSQRRQRYLYATGLVACGAMCSALTRCVTAH